MNRTAMFAAALCTALASCKPPAQEPVNPTVVGSTNVQIRSMAVYPAEQTATDSSQAYYIVCLLTFTNTLGHDVTPQPKNFVFYDAYGQLYTGVDSGTAHLMGVDNYSGVVKVDTKQDYTIGFRVPAITSGSVYYAAY